MSKHPRVLATELVEDHLTHTSEQIDDNPSFDLGDFPSEVMARRAVWAWMRSYWARGIKQRNRNVQTVGDEPRYTGIGAKA